MEAKETVTVSYRIKNTTRERALNLGVLGKGDFADAETCYSALLDAYEFSQVKDHSEQDLDDYKQKYSELDEYCKVLQEKCKMLQEENENIGWDKIKRHIQPFVVELLEVTASKLSVKYSREISPMQIMVDMFLRYTIERWNQWFYPFVLKDDDIIAIAQKFNPEIKNISQIKSFIL